MVVGWILTFARSNKHRRKPIISLENKIDGCVVGGYWLPTPQQDGEDEDSQILGEIHIEMNCKIQRQFMKWKKENAHTFWSNLFIILFKRTLNCPQLISFIPYQ